MTNNFQRFAMLVGENKIDLLNKKKVLIFGLGGVGGSLLKHLPEQALDILHWWIRIHLTRQILTDSYSPPMTL